jgi:hypothetical protein
MEQPIPEISDEDVLRLISREFPAHDYTAVRAILSEYGSKGWHSEVFRVRAAMLKYANGSVDALKVALFIADQDYRDILATAEYPAFMKAAREAQFDSDCESSTIKRDADQYNAWLKRT